jgi:hypothetical protein
LWQLRVRGASGGGIGSSRRLDTHAREHHTHSPVHTYAHTHTNTHTHTHTTTHTRPHSHTQPHIHTTTHSLTHSNIHQLTITRAAGTADPRTFSSTSKSGDTPTACDALAFPTRFTSRTSRLSTTRKSCGTSSRPRRSRKRFRPERKKSALKRFPLQSAPSQFAFLVHRHILFVHSDTNANILLLYSCTRCSHVSFCVHANAFCTRGTRTSTQPTTFLAHISTRLTSSHTHISTRLTFSHTHISTHHCVRFNNPCVTRYEDSQGNVVNKKTYEDLRRQGLL